MKAKRDGIMQLDTYRPDPAKKAGFFRAWRLLAAAGYWVRVECAAPSYWLILTWAIRPRRHAES